MNTILPLYLPQAGCQQQCVYCNQPLTVGAHQDRPDWQTRLAQCATNQPAGEWEIAFYGGTFTALPREFQSACFEAAARYRYQIAGYRISTRPDAVDPAALRFLRQQGVKTIELGVESLDDAVLQRSGRGHDAATAIDACRRIADHGFTLGIHLMTGLPGQSDDSWRATVQQALCLPLNLVRLSPTLVLRDTPLARLYQRGRYQPQPLDDAIRQCAFAYRCFYHAGVRIARVGLGLSDSGGDGQDKIIAGPWHPALRQAVESTLARASIARALPDHSAPRLIIQPKDQTIVLGEKNRNRRAWERDLGRPVAIETDAALPRGVFRCGEATYCLFGEADE